MTTKEVIHLVGAFRPEVLERWTAFAKLTNREIRHTTYAEIAAMPVPGKGGPIIIMCTDGLNDLELQ